MTDTDALHVDQIAYWNGPGGAKWVAQQAATDIMLAPVAEALIAHANVPPGGTIIDIGCGCGATTLALAQKVGSAGKVTALDVSAPMLDVARRRLAPFDRVQCIVGDAATYDFPAGAADLLISRFGVMFFGDPTAAFANMRRGLKPDGRVVIACWRPIDQNPWMQIPLHAAYKHVPRLPRPAPDDPGPFSFADPARVTRIFVGAGLTPPRFTPLDVSIDLASGGGLDAAVDQACEIGATSRALQGQSDEAKEAVKLAVREVLAPYVTATGVPLGGAAWLVDSAPA